MALSKNPKYDLKRTYSRVLQISIIISLMMLILAFKFFPDFEIPKLETKVIEGPIITIFIPNTEIETKPPLPRPVTPDEMLLDELLDDIEIESTELIINAKIAKVEPRPTIDENIPEFEFIPVAEVMPQPIGGIGAIQAQITYPELAIRAGVHGKVYIKAYVDEKGNVIKVELQKGIGAGCDEEAMIAVKSTLFFPGKQRGRPVKVQVTVPINFKLQ